MCFLSSILLPRTSRLHSLTIITSIFFVLLLPLFLSSSINFLTVALLFFFVSFCFCFECVEKCVLFDRNGFTCLFMFCVCVCDCVFDDDWSVFWPRMPRVIFRVVFVVLVDSSSSRARHGGRRRSEPEIVAVVCVTVCVCCNSNS